MAVKSNPVGIYNLFGQSEQDTFSSSHPVLDAPSIQGVRWHIVWDDIQHTNSSTYTWATTPTGTGVSQAISICAAKGKKIGISIGAGQFTPRWVYTADGGTAAYQYTLDPSDTFTNGFGDTPLPWDAAYQAKIQTFITACGALLDTDPTVAYIVVGGFMELAELPICKVDVDVTNMNNIAKAPATYAPGHTFSTYSDVGPASYTAPWGTVYSGSSAPKHTGDPGFALVRAYLEGAWTILNMFRVAFPNTPLLLTGSQGVFGTNSTVITNTNWGTWTSSRVREAFTGAGSGMGLTYSSLYAELPDFQTYPANGHYDPSTFTFNPYPTLRQVIYNVGHTGRSAYQGVPITYTDGITSGTSLTSAQTALDDPWNNQDIGRTITGANFTASPATTIASYSGNTVTLSQPALSNASGVTFTVQDRTVLSSSASWPQYKGIRDQCEACIDRGGRAIELWSPEAQATTTSELAQLATEAARFTSVFGGGGGGGVTYLPSVIKS